MIEVIAIIFFVILVLIEGIYESMIVAGSKPSELLADIFKKKRSCNDSSSEKPTSSHKESTGASGCVGGTPPDIPEDKNPETDRTSPDSIYIDELSPYYSNDEQNQTEDPSTNPYVMRLRTVAGFLLGLFMLFVCSFMRGRSGKRAVDDYPWIKEVFPIVLFLTVLVFLIDYLWEKSITKAKDDDKLVKTEDKTNPLVRILTIICGSIIFLICLAISISRFL